MRVPASSVVARNAAATENGPSNGISGDPGPTRSSASPAPRSRLTGNRHLCGLSRSPNGDYANATGNLNTESEGESQNQIEECTKPVKGSRKRWAWAALIARVWSVDPELCPRCHQKMKRARPLKDFEKLRAVLLPLKLLGYRRPGFLTGPLSGWTAQHLRTPPIHS